MQVKIRKETPRERIQGREVYHHLVKIVREPGFYELHRR